LIVFVGTVEESEFELVPSEPIAESVVSGWCLIRVTGDFDTDECELLGRRRNVNLFVDREDVILVLVFFFRND
jgi:hypothetical protein